jgi:LmbE family N-acetylglucosaminyl deacetylase
MGNSKPGSLRLMAILAHPDDESLGVGGTLLKYASEGIETFVITATKGQKGRYGDLAVKPSLEEVGALREKELISACEILGVKETVSLGYMDGELDQADPKEIISEIASHIQRIRPHVVVTFGLEGGYGHPDHIAISQFTNASLVKAADSSFKTRWPPHPVYKCYWMAWPASKWEAYQAAFKEMTSRVDGVKRKATPYPDWAITTRINTAKYWKAVWKAVQCHKTQMSIYRNLENLTEEQHKSFWGVQEYYRVVSLINGGRKLETDLFEGIVAR